MAYVVVRDPNGKVLQKQTLERSLVIGRSADCDIRLCDTQVSRQHCELVPEGKGWKLRDLGSRNGTYVNGKAVREHALRDGDTIEIGPGRIAFFAARSRRSRAADPVVAGLVDAESAAGPTTSFDPADLGPSESSLFATRVMVVDCDESTIAGARAHVQNPSFTTPIQTISPTAAEGHSKVGRLGGAAWRAVVGAVVLMTTFVIIWLYFAA